jgi:putative acetyltransferase
MAPLRFATEDPRTEDVTALLNAHLAFSRETSPAEHVHALDVDRLLDPAVTFFTARRDTALLAMGALRELDPTRAELKSMHVQQSVRGQGMGRAMVEHLLSVARQRDYAWLGLETGTMEAFAPARRLYLSVGFTVCEPFGEYTVNAHSTCMSMRLAGSRSVRG